MNTSALSNASRRRLLLAATAAPLVPFLAACAGAPGTRDGPPAPAPTLRVGDRWVYSGRDGFRDPLVWEETREVVAIAPGAIDIRVTWKGNRVDSTRVERWTLPGDLAVGAVFDIETRRFTPPLPRSKYPLAPGDSWSLFAKQVNETTRRDDPINYYVKVAGWKTVATPAGSFDAIGLRIMMRLDDEEFWRTATEANYLFWYAPAVGNTVLEEKEAQYYDKGDPMSRATYRSQHGTLELVSVRRG
ncbi:MAG: hypothetical protein ABI585_00110 [Betaproteobacteria bacterium]